MTAFTARAIFNAKNTRDHQAHVQDGRSCLVTYYRHDETGQALFEAEFATGDILLAEAGDLTITEPEALEAFAALSFTRKGI